MIEKLLKRIAGRLDKAEIPSMVIDGQAVLLYGTPRLARDIDITLGVDTDARKIRIDFIFSFTPSERQAMKRVRKVLMGGYPVKFASPEDMIIHKMFAGRAVDLEDVKNILLKLKSKINLRYIKKERSY